jgi:PAS domain S-box-containing protein
MEDSLLNYSSAILNSDFNALIAVRDSHIVWANDAMHRMFGYEDGELIGQPTRILFIDESSYNSFADDVKATLTTEKAYTGTHRRKCEDGSVGWFQCSIAQAKGQPEFFFGSFVDETERRALQEELEVHRTIVQDQTEAICRFFTDGTFNFVNDVYCRLFGKSREELIGFRWQPVAHPDDLPIIIEKLGTMTPANPVVTIENRVTTGVGEWRWFQFVNRGLFDTNGNLREVQSVGRDISERKENEQRLQESEERLNLALVGSGLVLWDWNITERKVTPGHRWTEILGYTHQELSAREDLWLGLVHPSDLKHYKQKISAHLDGEDARFESELRLKHKEGHWVNVLVFGKVISREKGGKPSRMIGTAQDVTQRKRLNEQGLDLLRQIEGLIKDSSAKRSESTVALASLTKREGQILAMIAEGMTSAQIAQKLNVATNTVISHRQKMMVKLGLHSTAEVIRFALDNAIPQANR